MIGEEAINAPDVIAEVRAEFERYERALRAHDVPALNGFFLERADTVRFGVSEHNYGIEAIRWFRTHTAPIAPGRALLRTTISAYGRDLACVSAEFLDPTATGIGRQTQTWVRVAAGWRIVAAHVSVLVQH
jgi:hypothetical protein